MSRLGEYTFLTTDLLTGEVKSVVELSSFYWDEVYNNPGAGLATARIDLPTTTPENFKDWATGIWAIKDGTIKWGGIVGKTQRRGNTRVLSIPIHGFFEYYRNRLLRGVEGMAYGQLLRVSDIEWRNVDQFRIAEDYINHARTFIDGDINVGLIYDSLSGIVRTSVRRQFTVKRIGVAIEEMMASLTGFDYHQVYELTDGVPRADIKLSYPPHATTVTTPLLFMPEKEVSVTTTLLRAMDTDGTSGAYASGGDTTSLTGDIDVIVQVEMDDWTPSALQTLRAKWLETGDQRSWRFQLNTDGKLRFEWSTDGTAGTVVSEDADTAVSFADGTTGTVRVNLDVDNGDSDYTITFYESSDGGVTWDLLTTPPPDLYETTYSVLY